MKLYKMQSRQVEPFPSQRGPVTVYLCSKAPYPTMDLQHAYTYAVVDCLIRFLEFQGQQVTYVQDIIDLDDHIQRRVTAGERGSNLRQQWTVQFIHDLHALHIRPPDNHFYQHLNEQPQVALLVGGAPSVCFWLHITMAEAYADAVETRSHQYTNPMLVSDLQLYHTPDALRFYLASHHYRQPWSFSLPMLVCAAEHVRVIEQAVTVQGGWGRPFDPRPISQYVLMALNDDLNTTNALTALLFLAEEVLSAAAAGQQVTTAQSLLRALSGIFGLRLGAPTEGRVNSGWQRHLSDQVDPPKAVVHQSAIHNELLQRI